MTCTFCWPWPITAAETARAPLAVRFRRWAGGGQGGSLPPPVAAWCWVQPVVHAVPLRVKLEGAAELPEWLTWKPRLVLPPAGMDAL